MIGGYEGSRIGSSEEVRHDSEWIWQMVVNEVSITAHRCESDRKCRRNRHRFHYTKPASTGYLNIVYVLAVTDSTVGCR
ncbi:hypothetical protein C489_11345 [Natrinema versiforme JCM 10478]|uniref:Uncharacterized protein n=1 Tax=Natrinema versiforme JCM 10478 TaxID=1227496 RepID=L9XZ56_9EURY|nr:hypothetical protein C489_11345 [Natrinema versiforme JCM 10478]